MEYKVKFLSASCAEPNNGKEVATLSLQVTEPYIIPLLAVTKRQAARMDLPEEEHKCARQAWDELRIAEERFREGQESVLLTAKESKGVAQAVADFLLDAEAVLTLPEADISVLEAVHRAADEYFGVTF